MFQDKAVIAKDTDTMVLFDPNRLVKWNQFSTPEETLTILSNHELSSFMNVLEMCRILYEAKANWRGLNKITTEKPMANGSGTNQWEGTTQDDWDRFNNQLTSETGLTNIEVGRLIRIHASWLNKGCVKRVFEDCAYLPTSKTALYEMATLDPNIKTDNKIIGAIIDFVRQQGEISVTDVREIKRNKGEEKAKLATGVSNPLLTNLKMPTSREQVEKLDKKWKEVSVHLETINDITSAVDGFGIAFQTPKEVLKQMDDREVAREQEWCIRKAHTYVSKFVIKNVSSFTDLEKQETKENGEPNKAAQTFNKTLNEFLEKVKKHKIHKDLDRIVKDRLSDVDTMKTKGLRANTSFKTIKKTRKSETVAINPNVLSDANTASSFSEGDNKWRAANR